MGPSILITGPPFTGAEEERRPNRLNIFDLVQDETQFSLYIQALRNILNRPEDGIDSFYAVAGIHGYPYEEWNDSGAASPPPRTRAMGYCTHRNTLFPTWHRPYMFFFEQLIQAEAAKIADTYSPDLRTRFQDAARVLRQPFWDWASDALPPVEVYKLDTVDYLAPNGNRATMQNPFRRYAFKNGSNDRFPNAPYYRWPTTLRQPTSTRASATDDIRQLEKKLQKNGDTIRSRIFNTLTTIHDWPRFSNSRTQSDSSADSIEAIHDDIHVLVGGQGHMGDISTAGFDPIFYLHHSNVDRMIALWSALNPGVWVSQDTEPVGTWTIQANSPIGVASDLTPFWRTNTTYWNSNDVLTTAVGGYTYPDFNGLSMSASAAETQSAIVARVEELYGRERRNTVADDTLVWDWQARVSFNPQEYGSSYEVMIFVGDVPTDSTQWYDSDSYVGSRYAWANSLMTEEPELHVETSGYIPLTDALSAHNLTSLAPDDVTPYVGQALSWGVQTTMGEVIPCANLTSLSVTVMGTQTMAGGVVESQLFGGIGAGCAGSIGISA
ncbi:Di-copper centre-containing protein [Cylindrobasidium torrendii FP15055 ss-10]|uniref:tyrosinase n=1 Tax=Cylindrobasidium torrendii FP15055 ss-10 TaxID=1314674 RepID=A0A0D7BDR1_9AGAR|nr:Di-copper centre-containing protein [Cylindrobasidium torrendii FP15055 ss-10]